MAYSSKYYDPVKAHEYYINYRKKGLKKGRQKSPEDIQKERKSTKGLNEYGKQVAQDVKEAIAEERKELFKKMTEIVKEKVKKMREEFKAQGLSKEEIAERISQFRETVKEQRKQLKAVFEEKYLHELDEIKKDPEMRASGKKKKSKKK